MAEKATTEETKSNPGSSLLDRGTYEIIRQRLNDHGAELRRRLGELNAARQEVFGSIKTTLLATERVTIRTPPAVGNQIHGRSDCLHK